jgi:predicted HicB family RNase H-like nuclease
MVIRKKEEDEEQTISESVRKQIISKGGSVFSDKNAEEEWTTVSLRITKELIETIDKELKERIGISRNAWILEAIQQKIKREKMINPN